MDQCDCDTAQEEWVMSVRTSKLTYLYMYCTSQSVKHSTVCGSPLTHKFTTALAGRPLVLDTLITVTVIVQSDMCMLLKMECHLFMILSQSISLYMCVCVCGPYLCPMVNIQV